MSLPPNGCGECNACCFLPSVYDDENKLLSSAGQWCKNCDIGVGCKIYQQRPSMCRDYSCFWLKAGMPQQYRPDKWGIKLDFSRIPDYHIVLVSMWEFTAGAFEQEDVKRALRSYADSPSHIVELRYLDGKKHILPPNKISRRYAFKFLSAVHRHWKSRILEMGLDVR